MERVNDMTLKLFDHEAYAELVNRIGEAKAAGNEDAADDLMVVDKGMNSFLAYVNDVDGGEVLMKVARFRNDPEDFRRICEKADQSRRNYHEAAIVSASMLNRIARFYGVSNIFLGNPGDRYQIADFCLDVVNQIFKNRKK